MIIKEYPATDAIASEKALPTIGIKLSTANFVVFKATASIVVLVIPLIVKRAIKDVIIIPWSHTVHCFNNLHRLSILCSSERLLANCRTKPTIINGIITVTYILGIITTAAITIGSIVAAWVTPPAKAIIVTRTGKIAAIKSATPLITSFATDIDIKKLFERSITITA